MTIKTGRNEKDSPGLGFAFWYVLVQLPDGRYLEKKSDRFIVKF